ncbi:hypothetical protein MKEN_00651200 [Mycena kentingensis (nom. inval.)]|nr:hypothetical protein MKEN_00651200 [Mycena kentingensis (nom. inval.)]
MTYLRVSLCWPQQQSPTLRKYANMYFLASPNEMLGDTLRRVPQHEAGQLPPTLQYALFTHQNWTTQFAQFWAEITAASFSNTSHGLPSYTAMFRPLTDEVFSTLADLMPKEWVPRPKECDLLLVFVEVDPVDNEYRTEADRVRSMPTPSTLCRGGSTFKQYKRGDMGFADCNVLTSGETRDTLPLMFRNDIFLDVHCEMSKVAGCSEDALVELLGSYTSPAVARLEQLGHELTTKAHSSTDYYSYIDDIMSTIKEIFGAYTTNKTDTNVECCAHVRITSPADRQSTVTPAGLWWVTINGAKVPLLWGEGCPWIQAEASFQKLLAYQCVNGITLPAILLAVRGTDVTTGFALRDYSVLAQPYCRWIANQDKCFSLVPTDATSQRRRIHNLRIAAYFVVISKALRRIGEQRIASLATPMLVPSSAFADTLAASLLEDIARELAIPEPARLVCRGPVVEYNPRLLKVEFAAEDEQVPRRCVVKFVYGRYGEQAHKAFNEVQQRFSCGDFWLIALFKSAEDGKGMAPKLYSILKPVPESDEWQVAVMDYVDGVHANADRFVPEVKHLVLLHNLLDVLRKTNVVHGDLRPENMLFTTDGGLKIIDWDWAGVGTECNYTTQELNPAIPRCRGAKSSARMRHAHDQWQLARICQDWIDPLPAEHPLRQYPTVDYPAPTETDVATYPWEEKELKRKAERADDVRSTKRRASAAT